MSDVLTAIDGTIATITLNRPAAMNAVTVELSVQLENALHDLADHCNVIVIRGAGGNFCAGGDVGEVERLSTDGPDALAQLFAAFGRACSTIEQLPVPVICAVEGYAMAGGFELMQAADIVLVSENAVIADIHTKFGNIPGGGSTQRLPRLVGRQRALAHILTADRLSGADALAWGLAYRMFPVDEFDSGVVQFASKVAAKDRATLAKSKELVYRGLRLPLEEGLELERQAVVDHLTGAHR